MLVLVADDVTAYVEEFNDININAVFFPDFSFECALKSFVKLHTSARDFPFAAFVFRFLAPEREKKSSFTIKDRRSHANSDVVYTPLHNTCRRRLFLATTLAGWFAAAFAHAVFDVFAACFTRRASARLTHTITPSHIVFYHKIFLMGYIIFSLDKINHVVYFVHH